MLDVKNKNNNSLIALLSWSAFQRQLLSTFLAGFLILVSTF